MLKGWDYLFLHVLEIVTDLNKTLWILLYLYFREEKDYIT